MRSTEEREENDGNFKCVAPRDRRYARAHNLSAGVTIQQHQRQAVEVRKKVD